MRKCQIIYRYVFLFKWKILFVLKKFVQYILTANIENLIDFRTKYEAELRGSLLDLAGHDKALDLYGPGQRFHISR